MLGLGLSFKISSLCGVWRNNNQPKFLWILITTTSFFISSTFLISQFGWVMQSKNLMDFNERLFLVPQFVNSFVKAGLMIVQRKKVISLTNMFFRGFCVPRNEKEVSIRRRYDKTIRVLSTGSFCMANLFIISTILSPLAKDRTLPRNAWLPFDADTSYLYWLSYIHQIAAIIILLNNTIATIWMMLGFMLQVSCQFVILRRRFVKLPAIVNILKDGKRSWEFVNMVEKKFIKEIVQNHLHLFKLTKQLNDTFRCFMVQQLCLITIVFSSSMYKLSVKSESIVEVYVVTFYVISTSIHLIISYWFANQIMIESLNFGNAIRTIDWTSLSKASNKDLIMILMRASKPNIIKCGIFNLTLEMSINILKCSYAIWNLLRSASR